MTSDEFRVLTVQWESPIMGVTVHVTGDMYGAFEVVIVPAGTAALGQVPLARFPRFIDPAAVGERIDELLSGIAEGAWPAETVPVVTTYEDFVEADLDAMAESLRGFSIQTQEGPIQ